MCQQFKGVIFEPVLWIGILSTSCKIVFRWMLQNPTDDMSTLVLLTEIRAWIDNHIHCFVCDVIALCTNPNGGLTKVPLKFGHTVYPKKYAHGFCFAVLCCGFTLTDFPIFIRLTSLALWQSNDCPSASKATLMNMDKYFMWIHYERLLNHNKAKHNKTMSTFLGIYCTYHFYMDVITYPWPNLDAGWDNLC